MHQIDIVADVPPSREEVAIVEDDSEVCALLSEIVEASGRVPRVASDGATAIRIFEEPFPPEIMILDLGLPVVDGYQVARAARARVGGRLWILALSGMRDRSPEWEAHAIHFDDFLLKPCGLLDIEQALERAYTRTALPGEEREE